MLVTEMGMRGLGQIAELCAVARPTAALVTSIGPEHLELVGTVADVARANAEAIEALPTGGLASSRPASRSSTPISATTSRSVASTAASSSEMAARGCSPWVSASSGSSCRSRSGISQGTSSPR